ncbi:Anp1-domain-containing protein [Mycotypha africana]|uniref:Anp1-domain-containing protein n=1 Tax=Mycotypha africana TaxID=64632 RepID=UPI002300AC37|nr:Anp1-domain-containing protein [Mycotypha africana]KAI8973793.1 Anp1-domain-containing protein [Mycotypha africana]
MMLLSEKATNLYTSSLRGNRRLIVFIVAIISFITLSFFTLSKASFSLGGGGGCGRTIRSLNEAVAFSSSTGSSNSNGFFSIHRSGSSAGQAKFINLNDLEATANAKEEQQHVLILTPVKNAEAYLERYFELVDRLSYPKDLITMAFLVSDTTDNTVQILKDKADEFLNRPNPSERYHEIAIYEKDFNFQLPEDKRHTFELQPLRRSFMARSRNYLLTAALREYHSWVLWLDVDVVEYPETIVEDLQSVDVDVVVPNCLLQTEDGSFWAYDKNNWQETERSIELQKDLDPDYVLLEGYYEFLTNRYLMVDMPTHLGRFKKVPLDGVGATFTLVKAQVHREGANFPPYVFQHQVETEGFAKMAKAMGFGVYGLPGYLIYHIRNS